MKSIKLIIFILLCFQSVYSQQPSYYKLGEKQFEGVQIYDVIQDKQLNYWFATDQGFYKYDSYSLKKIECEGMKGLSAFGFVINNNGEIFCYNLNHQILKIKNSICSVFYELKEKEQSNDIYLGISNIGDLIISSKTLLVFNELGKQKNSISNRLNYYGPLFNKNDKTTICHSSGKDSIIIIDGDKIRLEKLLNNGNAVNIARAIVKIGTNANTAFTRVGASLAGS